jgi:putative ABC transport system permease protein
MDAPVRTEMYFPYQQVSSYPWFGPRDLVIRTKGDPIRLVPAIREIVRRADPDQPVSNVATMDELLTNETGSRRLGMILLSAYAGLALLLASLGIYGVLSYLVTQQTSELGVRMVLGATRGDVFALVLKKGMTWTLMGLTIGTGAALGLTRLMSSLLFGVRSADFLTYISIGLLMVIVSLAACYVPARRAARVDPMVAINSE